MFPKIVVSQEMDGKNHGSNPINMDDLGGKTPIFGNIHMNPSEPPKGLVCAMRACMAPSTRARARWPIFKALRGKGQRVG